MAKRICIFFISVCVVSTLFLSAGCSLIKGSSEKVEASTESAKATESSEKETQGSGVEITNDKVCLIDYALGDFTKLQALCYENNLNLIKAFEPAGYTAISLAILIKPNDARLTRLYDYVNKGGKAICYYDNNAARYNDTFKQLFEVSITDEIVYDETTNSVTLEGKLFSDFTDDLKIAFIKKTVIYMRIHAYINDIDSKATWYSEFISQKTSKGNYFALMKNIGDGQILFIPQVAAIIPFDDDHYDDMDNSVFAEKIIKWSLESL
jgi:predicted ABC-type ATPase